MNCDEHIALAFLGGVLAIPLFIVVAFSWWMRPWWCFRSGAMRKALRAYAVRAAPAQPKEAK